MRSRFTITLLTILVPFGAAIPAATRPPAGFLPDAASRPAIETQTEDTVKDAWTAAIKETGMREEFSNLQTKQDLVLTSQPRIRELHVQVDDLHMTMATATMSKTNMRSDCPDSAVKGLTAKRIDNAR